MVTNNADSWVDYLDNPEGLRAVFGRELPTLASVELNKIALDWQSIHVLIDLELDDFPVNPPIKWQKNGYNKVCLSLHAFELASVSIEGWSPNFRCGLQISSFGPHIHIKTVGGKIKVELVAKWLRIAEMRAYLRSEDEYDI